MRTWIGDFAVASAVVFAIAGFEAYAQEKVLTQPGFQVLTVGFGPTSYIGVNLAEVDNERAKALKLQDVHGVEITRVEEDSPASRAGVKVGDVVLEYNGQRVEGMEQFGRFVRETPAGREVKLLISRGGSILTIPVTVGTRKDMLRTGEFTPGFNMKDFSVNIPEIHIPDVPGFFSTTQSGMLGIEAESLNTQLAEAFGVKDGVLVRWVAKDSAASKAGIRAGDVITKIDGDSVSSPNEVANAVRTSRAKKTFPIQLVRERRDMTVTVTIDQDKAERPAPPRTRVVHNMIEM